MSKLNCGTLLLVSLVLIAIPAPAVAQILGSTAELSFVPDHGVPGTSVTVNGTSWGALREGTYCRISGDPVEHSSCMLVCKNESNCDPFGEFTVADVPAGRYSIKVRVEASALIPLVLSQWFIVDSAAAETTTMVTTSFLRTTDSTSSLRTTYRSSSLAPTLSATVTEEREGFVLQSPMVVAPMILVLVAAVAVASALILRRRRS